MTPAEILMAALAVLGMMGAIIVSAVIVGNRVGRMEEQLSQIVRHLEQGEKRMDDIDHRISEHETRLGRLEPAR